MTQDPQGWRWRIEGAAVPLQAAVPLAEAARGAFHASAAGLGLPRVPDSFHGGAAGGGHGHAFWLAEDADGDGLADHLLVFCPSGIAAAVVAALAGVGEVFLPPCGRLSLRADWMGRREAGGLFGPAREWRALTPYVTPRWRGRGGRRDEARPGYEPAAQLAREIAERGLPAPTAIAIYPEAELGGRRVRADDFVTSRRRSGPPGDAAACFPELSFATDIEGPLAFGYAAHFGLGLMLPVRPRSRRGEDGLAR